MLREWRNPKTVAELTQLFLDHLDGKISTTPFSPTPLYPESLIILPELRRLTERGWWTVGSQPAVDGVSSSDEIFGWGPKAGYVFQKGFVEFFCEEKDVAMLEKRVQDHGNGLVHFFAGNYKVGLFFACFYVLELTMFSLCRESSAPMFQKIVGMP